MAQTHSIWLMPAAEDLHFFDTLVRQLSDRFKTPQFFPHLTLVEDMHRPYSELMERLTNDFAGRCSFRCAISGVAGTTFFFRSLYAMFERSERLLSLKAQAVASFGEGKVAGFMPHISLAYGIPEDQKVEAIAVLDRELRGRRVYFDTVAVAASGQSIPIEGWQVMGRHSLR